MSSSDLLAIGASGVKVYRAALGAVSENIANATTEGYNRRSVRVMESPVSAGADVFQKPGVLFGGVVIAEVRRYNEPYLDQASRIASASYEDANARALWMANVQDSLDDATLGVGQRLTAMFAAVERLAGNPTDTTLRQNLLFNFEQVNQAFTNAQVGLDNVKTGIASTAEIEVAALNTAINSLASANNALRRSIPGSANEAQLLDQRDLALANISKRIDASFTFGDHGSVEVTYDGQTVVAGITPTTFAVTANADGTIALTHEGTAVADPKSGLLAGLAKSAIVARDRVASLNTLANQYVDDINDWHQAGETAPGVAGGAVLSIGADAGTIQLLITDPADIAARSTDGRLNGNLVAIGALRGPDGVENGWAKLISVNANAMAATTEEKAAAESRYDQAEQSRAEVSGIDLDREAADMLRLQQAYQASARVIQVAREIVQTLFDAL